MTQSSCGESPGELPNSHDEPAARVSKDRHFAHHFIPPDPLMNYCTDLLLHFVHSSPNLPYPTHHLFRVGLVLHIPKGRILEPCIWMAHARKHKGNTQASNQPTNAKYLTALKNARHRGNHWCSWRLASMPVEERYRVDGVKSAEIKVQSGRSERYRVDGLKGTEWTERYRVDGVKGTEWRERCRVDGGKGTEWTE